MYIEQLYTNCLAEAAYYIESNGEAAIVDPIRETEPYLKKAAERGAKIKYIFETHFHADFVSGHLDLAKATGATIIYGPNAVAGYDVYVAKDNEEFKIGDITMRVLHTPGHTLESSCYLLKDPQGKDHAVFSGDTLFVGDVGRPDLAVKGDNPITPEQLAGLLYDSLNNKIKTLADEVILYPAHGPGSACGKSLGKETWSTIGIQKKTNYALQAMSREQFIREVTDGLLPPPAYFFKDAAINRNGYEPLQTILEKNTHALSLQQFDAATSAGAIILDSRDAETFSAGHIPGSVNIGLDGFFAIWTGTLLDIGKPIIIVAAAGREAESILRLSRVGYDNVPGYLEGGYETWQKAGRPSETIANLEPDQLEAESKNSNTVVLDVRKISEFGASHVKGAYNLPLDDFLTRSGELNQDTQYLVHCQGGYRSMIFASMMKARGLKNIKNVRGGFAKISQTGIALEKALAPVG